MTPFETALILEVRRVRARLALHENGPRSFAFTIEASGRVHDGEAQISFSLREFLSPPVSGGTGVDAVIDEFLRRNYWQQINAPLCLPNIEPRPDAEVALDTGAPAKYEDQPK